MTDKPQISDEEMKERVEHRDALLDINAILMTDAGLRFFRYLFKNLDVGEVPELGLEGNFLHEKIGALRVGHSLFKLTSEANFEKAAKLLAQVEKEKYEKLYAPSPEG